MRVRNDFYPTETRVTNLLLNAIDIQKGCTVLEPCAGTGGMSTVLYNHGCQVYTNEPVDYGDSFSPDTRLDCTVPGYWYSAPKVKWVISNVPFNKAGLILPLAYEHTDHGMAMLLRITYLEPCSDRREWLKAHADNMTLLLPVNPRPRFIATNKGTDSTTVAWYCWQKSHSWKRLGIMCPFNFG